MVCLGFEPGDHSMMGNYESTEQWQPPLFTNLIVRIFLKTRQLSANSIGTCLKRSFKLRHLSTEKTFRFKQNKIKLSKRECEVDKIISFHFLKSFFPFLKADKQGGFVFLERGYHVSTFSWTIELHV